MNATPSMIKQTPKITAIYIGCAIAKTARAIEMIPITNMSIEVKAGILLFEINPTIPKKIIINPTI